LNNKQPARNNNAVDPVSLSSAVMLPVSSISTGPPSSSTPSAVSAVSMEGGDSSQVMIPSPYRNLAMALSPIPSNLMCNSISSSPPLIQSQQQQQQLIQSIQQQQQQQLHQPVPASFGSASSSTSSSSGSNNSNYAAPSYHYHHQQQQQQQQPISNSHFNGSHHHHLHHHHPTGSFGTATDANNSGLSGFFPQYTTANSSG
jgi:hypothetical protein